METRHLYKNPDSTSVFRKNMTLGDKIRALQYIKKKQIYTEIEMRFGVSCLTIARVKNAEAQIEAQELKSCPYSGKRQLYANYPEIDAKLIEFMQFARSQRLPVSRSILRERARMAAESSSITAFKASNGYMQRFLRRNHIQKSIWLHGKGSSLVPMDHAIRMAEIRSTAREYPRSMVYNMDETGLFYRMGRNRTYLLQSEDRRATRGTEVQKQKQRITVMLCVNADDLMHCLHATSEKV